MSRPRHNNSDHERLLKEAERREWRITGGGNRHFKMWCPSPCKCMVTISTTPSTRQSMRQTMSQLKRATCWEDK